jgi:hypothetical protein
MSTELMLDVGQANDIKLALRRARGSNGSEWTNAHLTTLTQQEVVLGQFLDVLDGRAKIVGMGEAGTPLPLSAPTKWSVDVDGNIRFTVTSNGRTGEEWITYFENEKKDAKGKLYRVSDYAKSVLRNAPAPTNGVTYHIVVRPGKKIGGSDRITKKIRAAAEAKGWKKPHWEVGPLIRDVFTDKQLEEMGVWYIVAMHEPIKDSDGDPSVLCSNRDGDGLWLHAYYLEKATLGSWATYP